MLTLAVAVAPAAAVPSAAQAAVAGASPLAWDGVPGYSYAHGQTDQLGLPGTEAGGEITPEGGIFTPSVEVTPWLKGRAIGVLARRGLPDPQVPLFATGADRQGASAAWWSASVGGVPSAVMALAPGKRLTAGIALRWGGAREAGGLPGDFRFVRPAAPARAGLYSQPGEPFAPGRCWKVRRIGSALQIQRGKSVVAFLLGARGSVASTLPGLHQKRCTSSPHSFAVTLRARVATSRGRLHVVVPFVPIPASDPRIKALATTDVRATGAVEAAAWKAQRAAGAQIQLPEPAVQKALDASIATMLVPRYQLPDGTWVQTVNTLQYHAYWLRDAATISNALDLVGLSQQATEDLGFIGQWQNPDGEFASRIGQRDGFGQALWALGQHVRLTGDVAFAQTWLPAVERAVVWAKNTIDAAPNGLLPTSDPHDNEQAAGSLTGDQLWGVAGLDAAANLAQAAGDRAVTQAARQLRDRLKAKVVAAARATAVNGRIRPVLDADGGFSWGELWAAWPYPSFAPDDPLVMSTLNASVAEQREGVNTYAGGQYLHLYTGFRVWQTLLRAGDQSRPLQGLYSTIAHLSSTGAGFETNVRPVSDRASKTNLAPHATLAGELTTFVHDVLARDQAGELVLLGALPSTWLDAGKVTSVTNLPTPYGPVSLRLEPSSTGAILTWSLAARGTLPKAVRFPLPPTITSASITGDATLVGRDVVLNGTSGSVGITWARSPDPGPTMAGTIAALQAEYVVAKKTPPR